MRINVLFGSKSDSPIFEPLCSGLENIDGVKVKMEVCSAHRDPERLREIIKNEHCDLYIAGAGLAAHLPGVIASLTDLPVIGIPCLDVLEGVDALLSILQMPKGKPVLTAGVNGINSVVNFVSWYQEHGKQPPAFSLKYPSWMDRKVHEMRSKLEQIGWEFIDHKGDVDHPPAVLPIVLADLAEPPREWFKSNRTEGPWLGLPVCEEAPFRGDLRLLAKFAEAGGLWLGVNNVANLQLALLKLWAVGTKEKMLLQELQEGGKASAKQSI